MPDYIHRPGIQIYSPPYTADKTSFYGFVLPVDKRVVQKNLIDPYLNEPLGITSNQQPRFEIWSSLVMAVFNHIEHFKSKDSQHKKLGWHTEEEFAIWIRVKDNTDSKKYWYHAFMTVDNFFAMVIGREVYGFPKDIGKFRVPKRPGNKSLSAEVLAISTYHPDTQSAWLQLAAAHPPGAVPDAEESAEIDVVLDSMRKNLDARQIESASEFLGISLGPIDDIIDFVRFALIPDQPFVFLKQIPEIHDTRKTCYQAIVAATLDVAFRRGFPLFNWSIELNDHDSHPLRRSLGLPDQQTFSPLASFWALLDFVVPTGRVLKKIS